MAAERHEPHFVSFEAHGYVVTHGCRYHPDMALWEPVAAVCPAGSSAAAASAAAEHFQRTPEDAMALAHR